MLKKFAYIALFAAVIWWGLSIRLFNAQTRLPHADECEQATTFSKLLDEGTYKYNPNGPHGPTLYYYALACWQISDAFGHGAAYMHDTSQAARRPSDNVDICALRICVLGVYALIFLVFVAMGKELGIAAAFSGFACLWVSGLSCIYSVYFVQESIFAFSILLTALAAWRLAANPSARAAVFLGAAAGFAQATKETAPMSFLAMALSLACCALLEPRLKENLRGIFSARRLSVLSGLALVGFAAIFCPFYSSFGENPSGMLDAFLSYGHFADKSQSAEHAQGALYYLKLLTLQKSEGVWFGELPVFALFLASAAAAAFFALRGKLSCERLKLPWQGPGKRASGTSAQKFAGGARKPERAPLKGTKAQSVRECARTEIPDIIFVLYMGLTAAINVLELSAVSYKTPWLLLAPLTLMCAVAGWGAAKILFKKRSWLALALLAGVLLLLWWQTGLSKMAAGRFHTDPRNPFLYSHTVADFANLVKRIENCSKFSEYGIDMPVAFATKNSPWPAPWFLRKYRNVGFWNSDIPKNLEIFEIVVCDSPFEDEVSKRLEGKGYVSEYFGLRKNLILRAWVKKKLFDESTK